MNRGPGWYVDPGGEPAMRYWDGSRWTERTRPISTADLPPLDFLTGDLATASEIVPDTPAALTESTASDPVEPRPLSTPPAGTGSATGTPPPAAAPDRHWASRDEWPPPGERPASGRQQAPAAGNSPGPSRHQRLFLLVVAFVVLIPATLLCLLPAAWAVRRFADVPGWVAFVGWGLSAVVLVIPAVRQGLARLAPSHESGSGTSLGCEPVGQLAALAWAAGPVLFMYWVVRGLAGAADRLWAFVRHVAETGKGRRTSQSTVAIVLGMIRGTIFWLLWLAIAVAWLLVHSLRLSANGLRWFAATCGDQIRKTHVSLYNS